MGAKNLPAGNTIHNAGQKFQERCNAINALQFVIFGNATEDSGMRDEMGAQRVLQVIKNQLERIKWFKQ